MKFWISGEIHADVGDAFTRVRKQLEPRLNAACAARDYGALIEEIALVPMILPPPFAHGRPERRLFQRKQRSADYRLSIPYEAFRDGDDDVRLRLLVRNVLDAVSDLGRKAGSQFKSDALIRDILNELQIEASDLPESSN